MNLNRLRILESAENLKRFLYERTGKRLPTGRAHEITACIQQGRLLYEAASTSPLEIRPLQQFYGMLAFARVLILARQYCALSTLRKGHGLRDISEGNARLGELKAKVEQSGTFLEFNNEVSALNRVRYHGVNSARKTLLIPTAASSELVALELTLKDVFARLPGLETFYLYTYAERPEVESLGGVFHMEGLDYFTITVTDPVLFVDRASLVEIVARLRNRFPYLGQWRVIEAVHNHDASQIFFANLSYSGTDDLSEEALPIVGDGSYKVHNSLASDVERRPLAEILKGVGGGYSNQSTSAIAPLQGHYLSEFSLHYVGLFLLSSLVRYRPDVWIHSVNRTSLQKKPADDQLIALIESFLELNQTDVPSLINCAINVHEDNYFF